MKPDTQGGPLICPRSHGRWQPRFDLEKPDSKSEVLTSVHYCFPDATTSKCTRWPDFTFISAPVHLYLHLFVSVTFVNVTISSSMLPSSLLLFIHPLTQKYSRPSLNCSSSKTLNDFSICSSFPSMPPGFPNYWTCSTSPLSPTASTLPAPLMLLLCLPSLSLWENLPRL